MTDARIYQKLKNAMQSGRYGTGDWILEYEPHDAQTPDPLMGWAGSSDTRRQLVLRFSTLEAATAYANSKSLTVHVVPPPRIALKLQTYADNFR